VSNFELQVNAFVNVNNEEEQSQQWRKQEVMISKEIGFCFEKIITVKKH